MLTDSYQMEYRDGKEGKAIYVHVSIVSLIYSNIDF